MSDYIDERNEVVSMKDWIITMLILCIPIVNIVMCFVWAFNSNTNPSKANFFKAYLVLMAIMIALYIVIFVVFGAAMFGAATAGY